MAGDALLAMADLIYAGGACDRARAEGARSLSELFGGAAVMLTRQAGATIEELEHAGWPEESVALCCDTYADPVANEVLRQAPTVPLSLAIRPDRGDGGVFRRTAIFVHAMQPFGLEYPLGALIARTQRDVSFVSIMGRTGQGAFNDDDERTLSRLIPALTSADRVRRLLIDCVERQAMLEQALDRVGRPVAIADETMRLRYANGPAQALLDKGDVLQMRGGRLAAPGASGERLRRAVSAAAMPRSCAPAPPGGRFGPLRIERLLPNDRGVPRPLAMVIGPAANGPSAAALQSAFRLTPREAEVAVLFAQGTGVTQAARRLNRSPNTIKTEARAIYGKLGVGSHAEACAVILKTVAD